MRCVVFRGKVFDLSGYNLGGNCKGYRYVCATCGELWGALETAEITAGGYIVSAWPCEKHGNRFTRGGSFLQRITWGDYSGAHDERKALESFSPELLRHEAEMKIRQILGE